jgi:TatD DNase family protein
MQKWKPDLTNLEWIDAHAHLIWPTIWEQIDRILEEAKQEGIKYIVNIGVNLNDFTKCLQLQKKSSMIINAIGMHPTEGLNQSERMDDFITQFRQYSSQFAAIGEIGLDYYEIKLKEQRAEQEKIFRMQLDLAVSLNKPIIIHCRNAEKKAIEILTESQYCAIPKVLMHCFTGPEIYIKKALEQENWYFTIPTSVVYKKYLQTIVKLVPLSRMMLETDTPFLSPFKDGSLNKPSNIKLSAQIISEIKSCPLDQVANITTQNAKIFFNIQDNHKM